MANQWGWDQNMAAPTNGWTVGQLLSPNYLRRTHSGGGEQDPWTEDINLDINDIEGSFLRGTGTDIRTALKDVAPDFNLPAGGPIDWSTLMNTVVPFAQQRKPASDFELIPSLIFGGLTGALGAGFGQGGLMGDVSSWFKGMPGNSGFDLSGMVSPELSGLAPQTTGVPGMGDINWDLEFLDNGGVDGPSGDWETWDPNYNPADPGGPGSSNWDSLLKNGGSSLLRSLFGGSTGSFDSNNFTATGGTDWGKILSGLIGYKMTGDLADKYFDKAGAIADKYKRPWDEWLPEARFMRDDPSQWLNTRWGGWANQVANEAARKSAAGGFNNSGTGANQIADTVLQRSAKEIYNPNYQNTLQAAGLFQSPSTAASIEGDLTKGGLNLANQANSNLGFAAREGTAGLLGGTRGSTDDIYNNIMKTFFS